MEVQNSILQIEREAARIAFGQPVLMNTFRAVVVEAIVAQGLGDRWRHCSSNFHPFDFERDDGIALEVKQSAARQSWAVEGDRASRSIFDIRERTGRYEGPSWVPARRRWADIYVFAHHPRTDASTDHRDPRQWHFYVAPAAILPFQNTLGLKNVIALSSQADFFGLGSMVECAAASVIATSSNH